MVNEVIIAKITAINNKIDKIYELIKNFALSDI